MGTDALLISLVPPVLSGVMWLLVTKLSRQMGAFPAQFVFQLAGVPMLLAIFPLVSPVGVPSRAGILLLIGLGVLITFALTLYFHALRVGNLAVVGPMLNTQVLITVPLAVIVLREPVYPLRIVGSAVVIAGIVLLGLKLGHRRAPREGPLHQGVLMALVATLGSGVYQFGVSVSDRWNGWYLTTLGIRMVIPVVILCVFLARRQRWWAACRGVSWKLVLAAALVDVVSFSTFNYALTRYEVSYVAVVYAATPFVSVALAAICLKERLQAHQAVGLALVVAGIVGVTI